MSQKFTVLLDLDGTLVDTAPDLMRAHNHVMKKFGYEERELSDIKKLAGGDLKLCSENQCTSLLNFREKQKSQVT